MITLMRIGRVKGLSKAYFKGRSASKEPSLRVVVIVIIVIVVDRKKVKGTLMSMEREKRNSKDQNKRKILKNKKQLQKISLDW